MKKTTLILTFIAALLFSCGGPDWRNVKEKQDLESSDWKFDEDGYFTECPAIAGCDEDGDCLMNVHDSNVTEFEDWRAVCEAKDAESPLATCMQEYTDEYNSCVGGDFEGMRSEAMSPTAAEYFKDEPEVIQVLNNLIESHYGPLLLIGETENFYKKIADYNLTADNKVTTVPPADKILAQSTDYTRSQHGKNAFFGPFHIEYERKKTALSGIVGMGTYEIEGTMIFREIDTNVAGALGGHAQILIKDISDKEERDWFNTDDPNMTEYIIHNGSDMFLTTLPFNKDEKKFDTPKVGLDLSIEVEKVGCYPIGGRQSESIAPGNPKLYESFNQMKTAEEKLCYEFFSNKLKICEGNVDLCKTKITCKSKEPTIAGAIQQFKLSGEETLAEGDTSKIQIIGTRKKEEKDGNNVIATTSKIYCFSMKDTMKPYVTVFAELKTGVSLSVDPGASGDDNEELAEGEGSKEVETTELEDTKKVASPLESVEGDTDKVVEESASNTQDSNENSNLNYTEKKSNWFDRLFNPDKKVYPNVPDKNECETAITQSLNGYTCNYNRLTNKCKCNKYEL